MSNVNSGGQPTVIQDVPAAELGAVIQTAGSGMTVDVTPQGDGLFTVTATPRPAARAMFSAAAVDEVSIPASETEVDYLELIPLPPKSSFNLGLASPGQHRLREIFGEPVLGGHYDPKGKCMEADNPGLRERLVLKSVGPFKVTGVDVAVESLAGILAQVREARPLLFGMLGTNGMACARFTKVNGKIGPGVSSHAWGTAIDFKLGGKVDTQGDNKVLRGSLELARFFNAADWYWGAGFPTEDGMHFEVSASLVERWRSEGRL